MIHEHDTMPGAVPTRIKDDQPVAGYVPRQYVVTGGERTSLDVTQPEIAPPPEVTLPPRPSVDSPVVALSSVTPSRTGKGSSEHPAAQSVMRLCGLLDSDIASLPNSELTVLRGDTLMLAELARLAHQRLDELVDKEAVKTRSPQRKARKKKSARKKPSKRKSSSRAKS